MVLPNVNIGNIRLNGGLTTHIPRIGPVQTIYQEPRSFRICGDLEVEGNITVKGNSSITDIENTNKQLLYENQELRNRIDELEEKLNMLWYAPGMPGFVTTQGHYEVVAEAHNNTD